MEKILRVKEDNVKERDHMIEMILLKQVNGELEVESLKKMIDRIVNITYFIGRLDGEKYNKGDK